MGTFTLDLNKFAKKANGNLEKVVRATVIELGKRMIRRTPVGDAKYWKSPAPKGYVGGRARSNWQYGNNVRPGGILPISSNPTGAPTSNLVNGVNTGQAFTVHYLANNVPYILRLENGHSKRQAPKGMMKLTVMEFGAVVRDSANGVK